MTDTNDAEVHRHVTTFLDGFVSGAVTALTHAGCPEPIAKQLAHHLGETMIHDPAVMLTIENGIEKRLSGENPNPTWIDITTKHQP